LSSLSPETRPERADRARNRDHIIATARDAFARADKAGEALSMNELARTAGVGVATLYRHFPTRDALAAAVYESKLDQLTGRVLSQATECAGIDSLRAWAEEFAEFMLSTRGMMDTLRAAWHSGTYSTSSATEQVRSTLGQFIAVGIDDGSIQRGVSADDIAVAILALLSTTPAGEDGARAVRLLRLFIAGLATHTIAASQASDNDQNAV
jgi:AcrR family transcriptional regulator